MERHSSGDPRLIMRPYLAADETLQDGVIGVGPKEEDRLIRYVNQQYLPDKRSDLSTKYQSPSASSLLLGTLLEMYCNWAYTTFRLVSGVPASRSTTPLPNRSDFARTHCPALPVQAASLPKYNRLESFQASEPFDNE